MDPVKICGYGVSIQNDDTVNAYADGDNVTFTTGMVNFAREDNDLALVIGHELAHNTMGHITKGSVNSAAGAIIGALIGIATGIDLSGVGSDIGRSVNSQGFEAEADYVGVYYTARAGYDTSGVAKLWRRMAAKHPSSIHLSGSTHPSSARRFLAIEKTHAEIMQKRNDGKKLIPERE